MTLEDALVELGLTAPIGRAEIGLAEIRAAYVRLLPSRRPDRDPAAFMRLREAYDLARAAFAEASAGDSVAAENDVAARPETAPLDPVPGPEIVPRPTVEDRLRAFADRLSAIPDDDGAAVEAVVSESIAELSDHPRPRWWLIRSREARGDLDGAREALREAARVLGPPFLHNLLWLHPAAADPGQVAAALASEDAELAALGAYAAARRGDFSAAASALDALIGRGEVPIQSTLAAIIALFLGPLEVRQHAYALECAFTSHVSALPPDVRPHGTELWRAAVVAELARLPADFPDAWRVAIVEGITDPSNDGPIASPAAGVTVSEARLWRSRLADVFPFISGILRLPDSTAVPRRPRFQRGGGKQLLVVVGIFVALIITLTLTSQHDRAHQPQPVPPPARILTVARTVCADPAAAAEEACNDGWFLVEEMSFSNCSRARLAILALQERRSAPEILRAGEEALEEVCRR